MTQCLPCFPAASLRSYQKAGTLQIIVIANELAARPKTPIESRYGAAIPAPTVAPTLPKLSPGRDQRKQGRSKQGRSKQRRSKQDCSKRRRSKRGRNGR
jgi:hypothetical protein